MFTSASAQLLSENSTRDLERSNYSTAQQHSNYWEALLFARFGWSQRKKINRSFSFISLFSAHSVNLKRSRSISKNGTTRLKMLFRSITLQTFPFHFLCRQSQQLITNPGKVPCRTAMAKLVAVEKCTITKIISLHFISGWEKRACYGQLFLLLFDLQ